MAVEREFIGSSAAKDNPNFIRYKELHEEETAIPNRDFTRLNTT